MGRGPNRAKTWEERSRRQIDGLVYYAMKEQEKRQREEAFDRYLRPLLKELETIDV